LQVWLRYDPSTPMRPALAQPDRPAGRGKHSIHLIHKRLPGMEMASLTTSVIRMLARAW
jgi:hypothetical protein